MFLGQVNGYSTAAFVKNAGVTNSVMRMFLCVTLNDSPNGQAEELPPCELWWLMTTYCKLLSGIMGSRTKKLIIQCKLPGLILILNLM